MDIEDDFESDITSLDNESTDEIEETSTLYEIWPCLLLLPFLLSLVIYAIILGNSLKQGQMKCT